MDCGSNAGEGRESVPGYPSPGLVTSMVDAANLGKNQVYELISRPGISLFLGYHPRANLGLALDLVIGVARDGRRALVLDCDHTITLDRERSRMGEEETTRVLISHPEDVEGLVRDLGASRELEGIGALVVNRPSSLVGNSDNLKRFSAKGNLWTRASRHLQVVRNIFPVLILEDSRRYDQVEYKVHPALYYLSTIILDSIEKGKDVQQYRILKKRSKTP